MTDKYGRHEILDRVSILSSAWYSLIECHKDLTDEEYQEAEEIGAAIADFYQMVGRKNG